MAKNKIHPIFSSSEPWSSNEKRIWIASTVQLIRNITKFAFPSKLESERKKQIIQLFTKVLNSLPHLKNPQIISAESLKPFQKEYLYEHFLTNTTFQQAHTGEAFVVDDDLQFLAFLNLENHIQFHLLNCDEKLEKAWNQLVDIETAFSQKADYAFSPKFGFLAANPEQCGTGLVIRIFLHVPTLLNEFTIKDLEKTYQHDYVSYTSLQGDTNSIIGDLLILQNKISLGLSEEDIVSSLHNTATKLIVAEKSLRNKLKSSQNTLMKDKISRAFGLLMHSFQLDLTEALEALSLCKLGLDLEWISGISQETLNALFFNCRKAHLITYNGEKLAQEEIPLLRAQFIQKSLKKAKLNTPVH